MPEAGDLKAQRDTLKNEVADIDGQLKIARLIAVEVKQSLDDLGAIRREQFQAVLSQRGLMPFSAATWQQSKDNFLPDIQLLQQGLTEIKNSVNHVSAPSKGLLLGLALIWVVGLWLVWRRFMRYLLTRSQPTRLRRSLLATMQVVLYVLSPTGALIILLSVVSQANALSDELILFVQQVISLVAFAAFIAGLGSALLSAHKPTWRLPTIPDQVARHLRWLPWALGGFSCAFLSLQKLANIVGISISSLLLLNSMFALGLNVLVGMAIWRATSLHHVARKVIGLAVCSSVIVLLVGYTALSNLIIQELIWLALVFYTAYLLLCLVGDIAQAVLNTLNNAQQHGLINEQQQGRRGQMVLLVAGFIKVVLLLIALTLMFLPFGEDPVEWLQRRISFLMDGVTFGEVLVQPAALFYAGLVFIVGVWVVQHLQRWLANQYLPYTGLDEGMSGSTARLVSYAGYVIAGVLALSTAGFGFERIAWILSALSVGVGFGLQAVVQNFVSGLLLLAERPIRVGDWITLGTEVEGNVRQINARATEIEMFDKSTVIVPNSDLITKTVRNITLSNPMGRAQITVIMPVSVLASDVRQCLFDAVERTEDVLTEPEPLVVIDGFEAGGIAFSLYFYLPSPRMINGVRSEVFFKILENFEKARLSLHPTQRMEMVESATSLHNNE